MDGARTFALLPENGKHRKGPRATPVLFRYRKTPVKNGNVEKSNGIYA